MIISEVNNQKYIMNFDYFEQKLPVKGIVQPVKTTVCIISKIAGFEDKKPIVTEISCTGQTHCTKNNKFKKEEGRKRALKRALNPSLFSKPERTIFWNNYFNRLQK